MCPYHCQRRNCTHSICWSAHSQHCAVHCAVSLPSPAPNGTKYHNCYQPGDADRRSLACYLLLPAASLGSLCEHGGISERPEYPFHIGRAGGLDARCLGPALLYRSALRCCCALPAPRPVAVFRWLLPGTNFLSASIA